jgi:hypothetical protein
MNRKIGSKFCIALLAAATLVAPGMPAEAQRAPRPAAPLPVVRAYELWVNQGIRSGRFVRQCASIASEGLAYPTTLPSTIEREGQKTVYGDINNDGVTDFIAKVHTFECGVGTAGWHGTFIVGISQGTSFSFGTWGDAIYTRYLTPIHNAARRFGFLHKISSIQNGRVSGIFWDNNSRGVRGYCEGYHDNSNVRRSFEFDVARGQLISVGSPVIDREWRCF